MRSAVLLLVAVSAISRAMTATKTVPWLYSEVGVRGPSNWGVLDEDGLPSTATSPALFPTCGTGKRQSPVNLHAPKSDPALKALEFHYNEFDDFKVEHLLTTLELVFEPSAGYLIDHNQGGKRFNVLQAHVHAPSEHVVGGSHAELELHIVHQASDGALLVVGLLFGTNSAGNEVMSWLDDASKLPTSPLSKVQQYANASASFKANDVDFVVPGPNKFNLVNLVATENYYTYSGSLTTPPCSEDVAWYVMEQLLDISTDQLQNVRDQLLLADDHAQATAAGATSLPQANRYGNNRPYQPLNGRVVRRYNPAAKAPEEPMKTASPKTDNGSNANTGNNESTSDDDDTAAITLGILGTVFGVIACVLVVMQFMGVGSRTMQSTNADTEQPAPKEPVN